MCGKVAKHSRFPPACRSDMIVTRWPCHARIPTEVAVGATSHYGTLAPANKCDKKNNIPVISCSCDAGNGGGGNINGGKPGQGAGWTGRTPGNWGGNRYIVGGWVGGAGV
jgi:hypothetical protein